MSVLPALLLLLVTAVGVHRLRSHLRALPQAAGPVPPVSVVVPARDEALSLPALLDSLARLDPAPHEVIVVDDGSTDDTADLAREAGATVLSLDGPPPGWTGKAWACHRGAAAASGELVLFLDADTVLAPGALGGLLAVHEGGLTSVQPFHAVRRPYEQLSAYFNLVSLLASAAFGPRHGHRPMAFGPCLLAAREDYDRAGGHTAVRAEILDDVALAFAFDRAGLPVRCLVGGSSIRMRMYPRGLSQLVEGWTKNVVSGASAAATGPTVTVSAWVAAHHAVGVGALLWLAGGELVSVWTGLWALAWAGVALSLRSLLRRIGSFAWWTWAAFPLTLLAFDLVFLRSAVLTLLRGSVRWRGRAIATSGRVGAP